MIITVKILLLIMGGAGFLCFIGCYIYVKLKMRGSELDDLEEYHFEFEDHHPVLAKYERLEKAYYKGAVIAAVMLFAGLVL
jgi:hypothetical protein